MSLPFLDRVESPNRSPVKEYLVISPAYDKLIKNCVPRQLKEVIWTKIQRIRTPWTIDFGIFKEYLREDREQLHNDCFEFDWSNVKQLKYKKSSEDEVKQAMKQGYYIIKEFYK